MAAKGKTRRLATAHAFYIGLAALAASLVASWDTAFGDNDDDHGRAPATDLVVENSLQMIEEGRETFRFETFGDEQFWGGTLRLHEAVAGAANGGVGPGLSPIQALALGLKVDSDALGGALRAKINNGTVDLDDPATTLELLRLDAVVGVKGFFDANDDLSSLGIQCALCHSTVDDSFQPSMGERLDGWPNRDLDVGAIAALAPDLSAVAPRWRRCSARTRRPCARRSGLGGRASSTPSSCSTVKPSDPVAARPRR